jgi:hypothetical protein
VLTALGNSIILIGALLISFFEKQSFLDSLAMSAGLVTTVGYSNFTAVTDIGKIITIGLMLIGTLFVWSYMGFLVTGLIAPELNSIEKDVHDVEKELKEIRETKKQPTEEI